MIAIFSSSLQAKLLAQRINLQGKAMNLKDAVNQVGKQSGYFFLYLEEDLRAVGKISVQLKNADLEHALSQFNQKRFGLFHFGETGFD